MFFCLKLCKRPHKSFRIRNSFAIPILTLRHRNGRQCKPSSLKPQIKCVVLSSPRLTGSRDDNMPRQKLRYADSQINSGGNKQKRVHWHSGKPSCRPPDRDLACRGHKISGFPNHDGANYYPANSHPVPIHNKPAANPSPSFILILSFRRCLNFTGIWNHCCFTNFWNHRQGCRDELATHW